MVTKTQAQGIWRWYPYWWIWSLEKGIWVFSVLVWKGGLKGIKVTLLANLVFLSIVRLPYIYLSSSYAYLYNTNPGIIIWSIIDSLYFLTVIPMFIIFHGRGILFAIIPIGVTVFALTAQIVVVVYQLGDKSKWTDHSFRHLYWNWSLMVNQVIIVFGFYQPLALISSLLFHYNGEVEIEYEEENENPANAVIKNRPSVKGKVKLEHESDKSESFDINGSLEDSNVTNQNEESLQPATPIDEPTSPNKLNKFSINVPAVSPKDKTNEEWSEDYIDSDEEKTVPLVRGLNTKRS